MKGIQTKLNKVVEIQCTVYGDERGFFKEVIHPDKLAEFGINHRFVQLNHSKSQQGILRGLHYQLPPYGQAKLVRVLSGKILDVAVDVRPNSPTFKQHVTVELSAEKHNMLYVPVGFAHGFYSITDCEVEYACSDVYAPEFEGSIRWNDPDLGVEWPNNISPQLSKKDADAPFLDEIMSSLNWPNEVY